MQFSIINKIKNEDIFMNQVYVYVGRFQLPHIGHESVMQYALDKSDHLVLLVGSSGNERSVKNPFTFEERKEMLEAVTSRMHKNKKVSILSLPDFPTDKEWTDEVQRLVSSVIKENDAITVTGCRKTGDESTYYLHLFPEWKTDFISEINFEGIDVISSTKAREFFYKSEALPEILSHEVKHYLSDFKVKKDYVFEKLVGQFSTKKLKF